MNRLCALALSVCASTLLISGCTNKSDSAGNTGKQQIASGERLMQTHCSSCHLPVPPELLDKDTWVNHVLPAMAPKLGIPVWRENQYYITPDSRKNSTISYSDWMKIVTYFEEEAPEKLLAAKDPVPPKRDSALFSVKKPVWDESRHSIATTTMVVFDPFTHQIYSGDGTYDTIYRWDKNLNPTRLMKVPLPGVHVAFVKDSGDQVHGVFTSIGTLRAVDAANGKVVDVNLSDGSGRVIAEGLPRPVYSAPGDFNKDGLRDWIVCGFGHTTGGLYLFEQKPGQQFVKKIIRGVPGAIDATVRDFNMDGWPDIMVLFAHADEGIWMFTNDKNGGFYHKNLLRFPPVYGSTSFRLADFNHDGAPDILYTAGDNADYSAILKPYHGVYIFLNRGDFNFEQAYFYPVNGTTKAIPADFDRDGDLDIAAISFFADLKNNPAESFIYFEQKDLLSFIPHTIPIHKYGRWISMDTGDFEGDGDPDIVLGNFSRGFMNQDSVEADWNIYLPFIVLENEIR